MHSSRVFSDSRAPRSRRSDLTQDRLPRNCPPVEGGFVSLDTNTQFSRPALECMDFREPKFGMGIALP
jgi:hypothetical protein